MAEYAEHWTRFIGPTVKPRTLARYSEILKLHVIQGEVDSAAATAAVGTCVETLGGKVLISQEGENLLFGGATITDVDIQGSNGIIHVIDGVVTAASTDCPA